MKAVLENTGGTPSLDLRYVIRSSPEFPVNPEEMYQWPSETDAFFDRSIPPKGQIQVEAGRSFNTFYADPQKFWYVSGAIHYRDQFRGSEEHISKFCFRVAAVKDAKSNTTRPGYLPCFSGTALMRRLTTETVRL